MFFPKWSKTERCYFNKKAQIFDNILNTSLLAYRKDISIILTEMKFQTEWDFQTSWMLHLMCMCVWNSVRAWILYRSFWQKWNFILGDKMSCKHCSKWNAYTFPSKYWAVLKCSRNLNSCEQNLFSHRCEISNWYELFDLSCERILWK